MISCSMAPPRTAYEAPLPLKKQAGSGEQGRRTTAIRGLLEGIGERNETGLAAGTSGKTHPERRGGGSEVRGKWRRRVVRHESERDDDGRITGTGGQRRAGAAWKQQR